MSLEEFIVFGMTTFGGLNEGAEAILLEIGRAYVSAAPSEEEAEEDQCHLTQQLLMVLNREGCSHAEVRGTSLSMKNYSTIYSTLCHCSGTLSKPNHLLTLVKTPEH